MPRRVNEKTRPRHAFRRLTPARMRGARPPSALTPGSRTPRPAASAGAGAGYWASEDTLMYALTVAVRNVRITESFKRPGPKTPAVRPWEAAFGTAGGDPATSRGPASRLLSRFRPLPPRRPSLRPGGAAIRKAGSLSLDAPFGELLAAKRPSRPPRRLSKLHNLMERAFASFGEPDGRSSVKKFPAQRVGTEPHGPSGHTISNPIQAVWRRLVSSTPAGQEGCLLRSGPNQSDPVHGLSVSLVVEPTSRDSFASASSCSSAAAAAREFLLRSDPRTLGSYLAHSTAAA